MDTETPIGNASIWVQQHTIYYRPVVVAQSKIMRRKPEFWFDEITLAIASKSADVVTVQDTESLNRHWATLYFSVTQSHIIPQTAFIHSKIAAKANRLPPAAGPVGSDAFERLPCYVRSRSAA